MNMSPTERLILIMLADVHKALKIRGEIDPDFVQSAVFGGHTWALERKYSLIKDTADDDPRHVAETMNILDMWRVIGNALEKLDPAERQALSKKVYPYDLDFKGFDGNNDPHCSIAEFIVGKLELYREQKDAPMNSHSSATLGHYQSMLRRYNEETANHNYNLTPEQIERIVQEPKRG